MKVIDIGNLKMGIVIPSLLPTPYPPPLLLDPSSSFIVQFSSSSFIGLVSDSFSPLLCHLRAFSSIAPHRQTEDPKKLKDPFKVCYFEMLKLI